MRGLFPLGSNYLLEGLDLARSLIYFSWKPMTLYNYTIKGKKSQEFLPPLYQSGFNQETDQ